MNQREIKFRFWEKDQKIMVYKSLKDIIDNGVGLPVFISGYEDVIVLMQFTGLLDKNGKEIFEGDIVKSISFDHEMAINEIIYNEKECAFTLKSGFLFARYENEVIGNIYENPDLILKTSE